MGRKVPPNWGKSAKFAGGQRFELVRVALDRPTDFTIYFSGFTNPTRTVAIPGLYHVSLGSGGIARDFKITAPVRGIVSHMVSQVCVVHCEFPPPGGLNSVLARAMTGLGKPDVSIVAERPKVLSAGESWIVTVPEYARRMRVIAINSVAPPSTSDYVTGVLVEERHDTGLAIYTRPAEHYRDYADLAPETLTVQFTPPVGGARVIVSWEMFA